MTPTRSEEGLPAFTSPPRLPPGLVEEAGWFWGSDLKATRGGGGSPKTCLHLEGRMWEKVNPFSFGNSISSSFVCSFCHLLKTGITMNHVSKRYSCLAGCFVVFVFLPCGFLSPLQVAARGYLAGKETWSPRIFLFAFYLQTSLGIVSCSQGRQRLRGEQGAVSLEVSQRCWWPRTAGPIPLPWSSEDLPPFHFPVDGKSALLGKEIKFPSSPGNVGTKFKLIWSKERLQNPYSLVYLNLRFENSYTISHYVNLQKSRYNQLWILWSLERNST